MSSLHRLFVFPRRWGSRLALSVVALGLASSCGLLNWVRESGSQVGSSLTRSALWRDSQTVTGTLGSGDQIHPHDGSFLDEISITAQPGQILIASMESEAFDAYLEVVNSQGQVIAFDDDSGLDVNALLAVRLLEGGSYTLRATSFEPESTGDYQLTYTLTQLDWQESHSGRLQPGSLQHPDDGSWMEEYPIAARAGQILIASMSSSDFDAFLQLLDPDGEVMAWDDDQGGGTHALMIAFLPRTGTYTLRANTYEAGEQGAYLLQYTLR
ncbi:PPC domain-containing protein [Thermostichus vulcanus]|uniref:PPC domain-containing protein n=1 Tax=Thermostichus vulcanus str. 'Rupite' TaxID=2813851 RepID=A0ABT0C9J9_THEVL|nr:PPC domain-containing protein [Thermostichus vulcanus]MCJ2542463.1 PPC domain-containing protein [Thermostichus vulcanus str. 'Rupite']